MLKSAPLRFRHIGLHLGDLDPALGFFRDHLQLELLSRGPENDPMIGDMVGTPGEASTSAVLRFPETSVVLRLVENKGGALVDTDARNPGTCHVAFYTDDLDDTWRVLAEAGTRLVSDHVVSIEGGVFDGGKAIYCVGPDGYRVEFLEGRGFLDGSARDPDALPKDRRANEGSHMGIHVRDRDRSLAFYQGLLGMEVVAAWLEKTPSTRAVIGYPQGELYMAILRMPGTQAYFEVIEYRKVGGSPIDTDNRHNGTCHMAFDVDDLDALFERLSAFGSKIISKGIVHTPDGGRGFCCEDPDGIRVQFFQSATAG